MADNPKESSKLKTDETREGSSSDDDSSNVNGGKSDDTLKTFKDLVGLLPRAKKRSLARR